MRLFLVDDAPESIGLHFPGVSIWDQPFAHLCACLPEVPETCVQTVATQGQASLPGQLVIVTDKGKTSKEQGNLVVKEAMCAMLQAWDAPFRSAAGRDVQKVVGSVL